MNKDHHEKSLISFTDTGPSQSPAIVLIHAFPFDQTLWLPQITALAGQFRVITLDLWGFGKSPFQANNEVEDEKTTMTEYADEVKQLLYQLQIQQAIIAGESMGGYISLAFLQKYPESVLGLILSATQAIPDSSEARMKREENARKILNDGLNDFVEGFLPKVLSSNASEKMKKSALEVMKKQKPLALAMALRGMAVRNDLSSVLAHTNLPVLILAGDQDEVIPIEQAHKMKALAANSQLVIVPGAGHLINLERPELWNEAVKLFFNDQLE